MLALVFADHKKERKGWGMQLSMHMLEERYSQAPTDVMATREGSGSVPTAAMRQAIQFEQGCHLYQRVQYHNSTKGVVFSAALLKRRAAHPEPLGSMGLPVGVSLSPSKGISISWAQRFRSQGSLVRGCFHAGECLPTDQIRSVATDH